MNLKTFTPDVLPARHSGKEPCFQMNSKNGMVRINEAACSLLNLSVKNKLQFHQSADDPMDWYVEVVSKNGFLLREKNDKTNGLLMQSSVMVRKIFESINYEYVSGNLQIAGDPVVFEKRKLYPLITLKLLISLK